VAEVQANAYNFFASHDIRVGGIMVYSGSVYVSFYSDDTSSNLTDTLTANGLELDSSLKFKTATINDQVLNCTNCVIVVVPSASATTAASALSQQTIVGIAVGAIVGGVIGGLAAAAVIFVAIFFICSKKSKLLWI